MMTIFNGYFRADKQSGKCAQLLQAHRATIDASRSSITVTGSNEEIKAVDTNHVVHLTNVNS